ncbi:envelope stress response protein PspG [Candidatus Enterovibrio altilux]|uniref:Inner membrane protein n=1 Tax=Candidatus Enterovibrio altilux TaxID=1927128 RepID=A0A291BBG4_9GAMM|nr:envelope stress response protein PspG [Candidatus Enterovibrio luxaltus]ATF10358.1 hypothetical protein BTN50_1943 [Candidatus Enterovibrio luxaltus]
MIVSLFLVGFTIVLLAMGWSLIGIIVAVAFGFVIMALVGMIDLIFKLLFWLVLIVVVMWLLKGSNKHAT